jgi:hypothetical protein
MVDAFRAAMLNVHDINVSVSLMIIVSFVVILYAVASVLLRKGIGIRS